LTHFSAVRRWALSLSIGLLLCSSANLNAANLSKGSEARQDYPSRKCGRCHAIEAVGECPLKNEAKLREFLV
jgi:hypothetical protein